jgi:hypothetical protein
MPFDPSQFDLGEPAPSTLKATPAPKTSFDFDLSDLDLGAGKSRESWVGAAGKALSGGAARTNATLARLPGLVYGVASLPQVAAGKLLGKNWSPKLTQDLLNNPVSKYFDTQAEMLKPVELNKDPYQYWQEGDHGGAVRNITMQAIANAPQQIIAIGSAMSGMPVQGLAALGGMQSAEVLKDDLNKGKDPLTALNNSIVQGTIEAGFENIGTMGLFRTWSKSLEKSFGRAAGKKVIADVGKAIAHTMLGEANEEFLTSLGQDFSSYVYGEKDALKGAGGRALNAGLVGGLSGAAMTAPAAIATGRASAQVNKQATALEKFQAKLQEVKAKQLVPQNKLAEIKKLQIGEAPTEVPIGQCWVLQASLS